MIVELCGNDGDGEGVGEDSEDDAEAAEHLVCPIDRVVRPRTQTNMYKYVINRCPAH